MTGRASERPPFGSSSRRHPLFGRESNRPASAASDDKSRRAILCVWSARRCFTSKASRSAATAIRLLRSAFRKRKMRKSRLFQSHHRWSRRTLLPRSSSASSAAVCDNGRRPRRSGDAISGGRTATAKGESSARALTSGRTRARPRRAERPLWPTSDCKGPAGAGAYYYLRIFQLERTFVWIVPRRGRLLLLSKVFLVRNCQKNFFRLVYFCSLIAMI
ncbi:hypothetical protein M885DRAFT_254983 [Pelagophyceae sp. CCMP2097]|nr:hypothetical protein M885DRAFT_254983 [Pelagophyceae sp. CCMP2097]